LIIYYDKEVSRPGDLKPVIRCTENFIGPIVDIGVGVKERA
jgi:hypothetical protein